MTDATNRRDILTAALTGREQEIMHYQINIDNYTLALEEIARASSEDVMDLVDFANQLRTLLASEKLEQKKSKIMLNVIKRQLE